MRRILNRLGPSRLHPPASCRARTIGGRNNRGMGSAHYAAVCSHICRHQSNAGASVVAADDARLRQLDCYALIHSSKPVELYKYGEFNRPDRAYLYNFCFDETPLDGCLLPLPSHPSAMGLQFFKDLANTGRKVRLESPQCPSGFGRPPRSRAIGHRQRVHSQTEPFKCDGFEPLSLRNIRPESWHSKIKLISWQ